MSLVICFELISDFIISWYVFLFIQPAKPEEETGQAHVMVQTENQEVLDLSLSSPKRKKPPASKPQQQPRRGPRILIIRPDESTYQTSSVQTDRVIPPTVKPYGEPNRTYSSPIVPGRPKEKMKLKIKTPEEVYDSVSELSQIEEEQLTAEGELLLAEETLHLKETPVNVVTSEDKADETKVEQILDIQSGRQVSAQKGLPVINSVYVDQSANSDRNTQSYYPKNISDGKMKFPPIANRASLVAPYLDTNTAAGSDLSPQTGNPQAEFIPNTVPVQTSTPDMTTSERYDN